MDENNDTIRKLKPISYLYLPTCSIMASETPLQKETVGTVRIPIFSRQMSLFP